MAEWLDNLKVGDTVIRCTGYHGKFLAKVARLTPTQIILESGARYRRKSGDIVGDRDSWNPAYLSEATPDRLAEVRKAFLCSQLREIQWAKIGLDALEKIYATAKNGQHLSESVNHA